MVSEVGAIVGMPASWMAALPWAIAEPPVCMMRTSAPSSTSLRTTDGVRVGSLSSFSVTTSMGRPMIPPLLLISSMASSIVSRAGTL